MYKSNGFELYRKTDNKGKLSFENLKPDIYQLEGVYTPGDYISPGKSWLLKVSENGEVLINESTKDELINIENSKLSILNKRRKVENPKKEILNVPNNVELIKVGLNGEKFEPLTGISFNLKKEKEMNILKSSISKSDGKFGFGKIAPGNYEVWEEQAPKGYKTPNKPVATFEVNEQGEIENIKIDGIPPKEGLGNIIVNKKVGNIEFEKVQLKDGMTYSENFVPNSTNTKVLQGTKFKLEKIGKNGLGQNITTEIQKIESY